MSPELTLKKLLGLTLTSVEGATVGDQAVVFDTEDRRFLMQHSQDCCEFVRIHSVEGDVQNIIGSPILSALEDRPDDDSPESSESYTWTLFTIKTEKGTLRIKWLGESNGYYGEGVDFNEVEAEHSAFKQ